ncbi:MAG: cyclic nucleotide-binding domain-containing protein [Chloroflexota bacterium]
MAEISQEAYEEMLYSILRENEAFTALSDDEVRQFVSIAKFRKEPQGSRIIEQGRPGSEFFIILDGQVRAVDVSYDPPHLLNYHDKGHIIGTRALLNNAPRAASVEVVIDAKLAIYNRHDWEWLIHRQSRIINYFENLELSFDKRALIDFPGRQWDEIVVSSTKRHIIAFLANLTLPLTLLIGPIIFFIVAELLGLTFVDVVTDNFLITALVTLPFIIVAVLLTAYHYVDWRNDDFILTTKRFIHIERRLFYGEERNEAPLTRIQDVTLSYPGFLDRFDYHHLRIRTAGAGDIFVDGILRAKLLLDRIFEEKARAVARVQAANVSAIRSQLASHLEWEEALDEPILAIAEKEGGITIQTQTRRLPGLINYFIPRMREVDEDGTTIIWRKHYWILFANTLPPLLSFLGVFYLFIASFLAFPPFTALGTIFIQAILGISCLATFGWYLWLYDGWRRDTYWVTETRVVDVQSSPFRLRGEKRNEGTFDDIQNITYDIPNFFSNLLNLGTVIIETAGTKDTFTFNQVFDPSTIQQEIFNRMILVQQREREQARDATTGQLLKVIGEYQHLLERATSKGIVDLTENELNELAELFDNQPNEQTPQ